MVALPSQTYAMPANAFVLVLLGVIVEFFARALLRIKAAWSRQRERRLLAERRVEGRHALATTRTSPPCCLGTQPRASMQRAVSRATLFW